MFLSTKALAANVTWIGLLMLSALLPVRGARGEASGVEAEIYARRPTWSETMVATRDAYRRWLTTYAADGEVRPGPAASANVPGDGAAQKLSLDLTGRQWLRLVTVMEEGPGNCHIWGEAKLIDESGTETKLSGLAPMSVVVGWGELHRDQNWQKQPLQIADQQFRHGIWVHANSEVTYALDKNYKRFEAFVGMDAARAKGRARFSVFCDAPNLTPLVWRRIAADFPPAAEQFTRDTNGRQLSWLLADSGVSAVTVARQVVGQLGPTRSLFESYLSELESRGSIDERQWLDIYLRACRLRDCDGQLQEIWLVDLQRLVLGQLEPLVQAATTPEDDRWMAMSARLQRLSKNLGPGPQVEVESLLTSIECLSQSLSDRFRGGPQLRERLNTQAPRWRQILQSALTDDAAALSELSNVGEEVQAFHRALLLAFDGMAEFLAIPANKGLTDEWDRQYATLQYDLRNREQFQRVASTTYREASLILDADRDPADIVLRRSTALLDDLTRMTTSRELENLSGELALLCAASPRIDVENTVARRALFANACRIRRQITFCNPLLDFDQILFIKRHRALFNHMCDQYYGMAATPGGGLYVLANAFGDSPQVRDVLATATVSRQSRLLGQSLSGGPNDPPAVSFDGMGNRHGTEGTGGTFLSPDLAYDGQKILFAYVENQGDMLHRHHVDPSQGHWDPGRCYHIFSVNLDGSDLCQLTDGSWNDFDPCWLPNGRIAFISERRGGYLRCGRVCPTYTLFDMAADGSDITCLSFHETNEWHPSVSNDGLLLWTRWDYIDRHGCTAHMPWLTTLDGRDPRAVHGNFSVRASRPDMEVDCRAVPGSQKLLATAAPHHGQAYGSLVLIDPHVPDDDAMGPVRRVTPEVGFPETQGGGQVYGTAWPLSEDYYLCVYDASMQPGAGQQGGQILRGDYGIYLADAFGNRELIYRDPEIGCLSPIPVRPRPLPPAAPELAVRGVGTNPATRAEEAVGGPEPTGTVAIMNVYDSLKSWPTEIQVRALRVLQVFPMSVPSGQPPHETGIRVVSAGDSVVPVRHVLGTVPVEEDGSVYFTVPANKELFFQALDEHGLAVQSMRSATHVREGERLVCAGCHNPRYRIVAPTATIPLALLRGPSELQPDVDGSHPFSYPRLVQPVLDRHCVKCHAENADKAPNLAREPIVRNWYASYDNLVSRYGFYDYKDSYRTTPGEFGAMASGLYKLLRASHHDVALSDEEMHRLTLWLDCTSMFYGVYEKEQGQAQLRGDIAYPTLQ